MRWRAVSVGWVVVAGAALLLAACAPGAGSAALPGIRSGAAQSGAARSGAVSGGVAGAGRPSAAAPAGLDRLDPVAVYRAWWEAVGRALAAADPDAAELATLATDPLLGQTRDGIRALRAQGLVQVAHFALSPRQVERSGRRAEIADCVRTPAGSYRDARTGRPRAPAGYRDDVVTSDSLRFALRWTDNGWYLVAATAAGGGPC
ncbi:MAG: hypothetical protein HYR62_00355 [Actinobacteria bacterium]|nr:hypothetical protein [Actinomycetota bacterium]MBI3687814.1 hypothetical protein [Actinomycetota bacterium]